MTHKLSISLAMIGTLSACEGDPALTRHAIDPGYYEAFLGSSDAATKATSASMGAVAALYVFDQAGGGMVTGTTRPSVGSSRILTGTASRSIRATMSARNGIRPPIPIPRTTGTRTWSLTR